MLKSLGHEIDEAANDRVAVRLMERGGVDLMLAGVDPADAEALELLSYIRRKHRQRAGDPALPQPRTPERTKEALRLGALAVLKYPVPATELRAAVTQALGPLAPRPPTADAHCPSPARARQPRPATAPPRPGASITATAATPRPATPGHAPVRSRPGWPASWGSSATTRACGRRSSWPARSPPPAPRC